jgi:hypothetical protein
MQELCPTFHAFRLGRRLLAWAAFGLVMLTCQMLRLSGWLVETLWPAFLTPDLDSVVKSALLGFVNGGFPLALPMPWLFLAVIAGLRPAISERETQLYLQSAIVFSLFLATAFLFGGLWLAYLTASQLGDP